MDEPMMLGVDCPCCKRELSMSTKFNPVDRPPQSDDLTVCGNCGRFIIFNDDLSIRLLEVEEFMSFDDETKLNLIIIQGAIHRRRRSEAMRNN